MSTDQQFYITQASQNKLLEFCKRQVLTSGQGSAGGTYDGFNHRQYLESIDREYARDNIFTYDKIEAATANRAGNKKKLQDIVIPLAESQVETMLSYLISVYLTGNPIFGVTSGPAYIDDAKAYQAILADQEDKGNWINEFIDNFTNALKYFSVMEVTWDNQYIYSPESSVGDAGKVNQTKKILWSGNVLKNVSPYNVFWDRRVPVTEVYKKAEFAGYVELESRTSLKQYIEDRALKMNIAKAYDAAIPNAPTKLFYVPDFLWDSIDNFTVDGSSSIGRGFVDDFSSWSVVGADGKTKNFKNCYYRVVRYLRIVPSDFDLKVPMPNQVQIWKIVTINDQLIIECERQNNNHNWLPLIFAQPALDGLNYNSRSFAQKQIPFQDIGSALLNGAMDSMRRAISDRVLYDPSRVTKENMSSVSPTARIPVRPSAYGSKISDAVYKFPYEDHQTTSFIGVAKEVMGFADMISGQNKAQQGEFVKGNKTQAEWEDVQSKSSGRQRKTALKIEAQLMSPIKYICKMNIMQYQKSGELYNPQTQQNVQVDTEKLRKAVINYTVTDGLIPENKVINASALQGFLQLIGSSPYLQSKYDIAKVMSYFAKTQNADLTQFEVTPQVAASQLQSMQQSGLTPGTAVQKQPMEGSAGDLQ